MTTVKPNAIHSRAKRATNIAKKKRMPGLMKTIGGAILTAVLATAATVAVRKVSSAVKERKRWSAQEDHLDEALADTMDASDPIAKY
ncbi:MAG: hypothetical protein ABL962_05110 [Fimbriimonadaceae bacterium]